MSSFTDTNAEIHDLRKMANGEVHFYITRQYADGPDTTFYHTNKYGQGLWSQVPGRPSTRSQSLGTSQFSFGGAKNIHAMKAYIRSRLDF